MLRLLRFVTKLVALLVSGLAVLSAVSLLVLSAAPAAASTEPSSERREELRNLLVQDCGSGHGLTLGGGLGPPIRAEDLAIKPVDYLAYTILNGRPGTAMPLGGPSFRMPRPFGWHRSSKRRRTDRAERLGPQMNANERKRMRAEVAGLRVNRRFLLFAVVATLTLPPLVAGAERGTGDLGILVERAAGSVQVIETTGNTSLKRLEGLGDLSHASAVFSRDGR